MKNFLGLFLLFAFSINMSAQKANNQPKSEVPNFKIEQTNGVYLQNKDLPRNKPLVVVYFSPNCDHCITLMDQLFPNINAFKKANLLLVTFVNTAELLPFEKKYKTKLYPNMFIGSEGLAYNLKNFYKLEKTPFTALYNSNGKLIASYKKDTPVKEVIDILKKM